MTTRRAWQVYLALLGLLVGGMIGLQVGNLASGDARDSAGAAPILTGDWYIKQALSRARGIDPERSARQAIMLYRKALPDAAAARRMGVTAESLLLESGEQYFRLLVSHETTANLTPSEKADLQSELDMWLQIYSPKPMSMAEARGCIDRISRLDLGPLRDAATASVYAGSDRPARAAQVMKKASSAASRAIAAAGVLLTALLAGGAVGLVLLVLFLARSARPLNSAPAPGIQPSVLLIGFFVYFGAVVVLSELMLITGSLAGLDSDLAVLALQSIAIAGAFALGWAALRAITALTGESLSEMGLRRMPLRKALKWGVGAYLTMLPVLAMALVMTRVLSQTVFRNVPTPEQPFGPMIAGGGALGTAVVFVLAALLAPVVEETFFRGALYGALRARLRVWPAALSAAAVFAVAHPLPGGFLPVFVLACVLAILREKTGSLLPGMICHALYNGVVLVFFLLLA